MNVAARVCAQAEAGEILVTETVRSLTRTYLRPTFAPRGTRRLKGISEPIALYRVTSSEVEEPGLVTADNGDGTVSIFLHRGLKGGRVPATAASSSKAVP